MAQEISYGRSRLNAATAIDVSSNGLARLGAKRIWRENMRYWELKPDYKPGEVFEI